MNEYYKLTDLTPVHYAGVALHPEMKLRYFDEEWPREEWRAAAYEQAEQLWISDYKERELPDLYKPKPSSTPAHTSPEPATSEAEDDFDNWREKRAKRRRLQQPNEENDAFKAFQSLPPEESDIPCDVFAYWSRILMDPNEKEGRKRLAFMGLDILCISPMSDEPERVFSSAAQAVTKRRNKLGVDVIEGLECIKSWAKGGIVPYIEGTEVDLDQLDSILRELEKGVESCVDKAGEDGDSEWESMD